MSLTHQRVFGVCRKSTRIPLLATPMRFASSNPHSHHDDANVYPQESMLRLYLGLLLTKFISSQAFNTPFWRNAAIVTLLGIGLYNLVPYLDKDGTYITRYIQHYATPSDVWTRINDKHLELSLDAAQGQLLIGSAMRPRVLRMRNPS